MRSAKGLADEGGRDFMDPEQLIVVGTFAKRVEADLAQGALAAAGIDAMVSADDVGGVRPDLGTRGIRVLVRAEDREEATAILNAVE